MNIDDEQKSKIDKSVDDIRHIAGYIMEKHDICKECAYTMASAIWSRYFK